MRDPKPNYQLQASRRQKIWTLKEAAEAVGVDPQTFWRWENGEQRPQPYALRKLCEVFGMSAETLGFGRPSDDLDHAQSAEETFSGEVAQDDQQQQAREAQGAQQDRAAVSLSSGLPVPFSLTTVLEADVEDWPTWFALKQTQILTMIGS